MLKRIALFLATNLAVLLVLSVVLRLLGVDRILDMCRTIVNITGDASCAMFVASRDGRLATTPTSG